MIKRLLRDQRGTALTEFLITLPIFIVMFGGIIQLGLTNERSVRVWVRAYRETFTQAYAVQRAPISLHSQATSGAAITLANINALPGNSRRMGAGQRVIVLASDGVTFSNLALNGTMGESYWRNRGTDLIFTQFGGSEDVLMMEGIQTSNIQDIVGQSRYAQDLFDDGPSAPNFAGGGAGPLVAINALLTAAGVRPTIVGGLRYGAVTGTSADFYTIMGMSYAYDATFSTLVAPASPITLYGSPDAAEGMATAVARLTMESYSPYSDMLGVQLFGGGVSGTSINVPCLQPNFAPPCP